MFTPLGNKHFIVVLFFIGILFAFVPRAVALDGPCQKLKRGLINIVTAPVEIPKQTKSYWIEGSTKTMHISAWVFCGLVKGAVMTIARIGSGIWDVLSFPMNSPPHDQPLLKPDYVFEQWPQRQKGVFYYNIWDR